MTKPISRKMAVASVIFWTGATGDLFCPECGMIIHPYDDVDFDHRHADIFGGEHSYKNIRPLHRDCHKLKTARDIKANAKIKRLTGQTKGRPKKKWASGRKIPPRPFPKRKSVSL